MEDADETGEKECTMTTLNSSLPELTEWREPFPEPRTIPMAWILDELMPVPWPFMPAKEAGGSMPLALVLSNRVRAVLARVGDFVSSLSHSFASR